MNKIIKDQLSKCRVAVIPECEDSATHIFIKKVNNILPVNMLPNHVYLIKIKPSVKNNDTIAFNWNGGVRPQYDYYKVEKIGEIGTMLKLNGIAFDYSTKSNIYKSFYGYLPNDGFEIIEEV